MSSRLCRITLSNIRNLKDEDLSLGSKFNVFVGANGSGKTSLLEAVHLLGLGRSFRATAVQQMISFGAKHCLVRGMLEADQQTEETNVWLAVEKDIEGGSVYKLGNCFEKSAVPLTRALPVQLIDIKSHLLIEGGPEYRRKFIDWGVFHVEHEFLANWRDMQRALQQRNAGLKQRLSADTPQYVAWNEAFIRYAGLVDSAREAYVARLALALLPLAQELLGITNLSLQYCSGWDAERGLEQHLADNRAVDLLCGFTNCGPHRADLLIATDGRPAKDVLSRGQLKVLASVMLLARMQLLPAEQTGVLLIDDLHAELDVESCKALVSAIDRMNCQVLITGIEAELLERSLNGLATEMFHVEHNRIKRMT